jgi:hypothetical protein
MKFTLNQLKVELKAVQAAHGMLSPGDFFWGDPSRAWEEKTLKYPLMCCYTAGTGGQMQERLTGVSLVVMIADKVYKDYKSLDDTESDTLNVSRQVFNVINKSGRWRKLLTVRSATATKFIDKGDDEITGWILQMQVDLKDSQSICDLPMFDYDFEDSNEGVACPGVTVINSNMTYVQLVASGGILPLPDITVTDSDGTTFSQAAVTDVTCSPALDATYEVEYENGTPIESGSIPSGGFKLIQVPNPITCADAVVNVNSVFFDNVASGGTLNIQVRKSTGNDLVGSKQGQFWRIADSTAVLKTSAGATISTTSIKAEESEDITAPDATVTNSNASYTDSVVSGGTLVLPDITVTDSDGSTFTQPSVENVVCTLSPDTSLEVNGTPEGTFAAGSTIEVNITDGVNPVTPNDVTVVGDVVTIEVPAATAAPVGATLMKTGQTTSYRTGDDGDIEAGRATDFFTLASNNPFGNTNRFTDELGGQTYTNDIVIDWSTYDGATVLGYYRISIGTYTWDNAVDNSLIHTIASFVSGWRLPNIGEWVNITNYGLASVTNYAPLNVNVSSWLSTAFTPSPTNKWFSATNGGHSVGGLTGTRAAFPVRTFTVTGTTLT